MNAALSPFGCSPEKTSHAIYFPSSGEYAALLDAVGLELCEARLFDRDTARDEGVAGLRNWVRQFQQLSVEAVGLARLEEFFSLTEGKCRAELWGDSWIADYRRLQGIALAR